MRTPAPGPAPPAQFLGASADVYCRSEQDGRKHRPARRELLGSDADGMDIFCIVFLDADGIWGADIYRADGEPWLAMPDPETFQPGSLVGDD